MWLRRYFLCNYSAVWLLVLYSGSCTHANVTAHATKEDKDYYTRNLYRLPRYALEEFRSTLYLAPSGAFIKKLQAKAPKWYVAGTEPAPYKLWEAYRKEREKSFPVLAKNAFKTFADCWGVALQQPTASHLEALRAAVGKIQTDRTLHKAFQDASALYHQPENFKLTQATVAYYRYLRFIGNKQDYTNLDMLLDNLKTAHVHLKVWKSEQREMGGELWRHVRKQYAKELASYPYFQYEENLKAIEYSLALTDGLAADPYNMHYKDLHEALPHGLNLLHKMLNFLAVKELQKTDRTIQALNTYCRLIHLSNILLVFQSDGYSA